MTTTILQETKQVITDNAIYDLAINKTDGVVSDINATVTVQMRTTDDDGGGLLSAVMLTITYDENGIAIVGTLPCDTLTTILIEFNEIINEIKG